MSFDELIDAGHGTGSPRDHCEFSVESLEVELADDTRMPLLDEKHASSRLKLLLDQLELALRKTETIDVVGRGRVGIWKEDLCRRLLDDGSADRTRKRIAWTLCGCAENAVELSPNL